MEVQIAEVRGQLDGLVRTVADIRTTMATKEGQAAAGVIVGRVEAALQIETELRTRADTELKKDIDTLANEVKDMKEKQENRKYLLLSAILVGVIGLVSNIAQGIINAGIGQ